MMIDRFSTLDDLKPRDRGDPVAVLRLLDQVGRFSVFEATEHLKLAKTLDQLPELGWVEYENDGFPWTKATVTAAGRAVLEDAAARAEGRRF